MGNINVTFNAEKNGIEIRFNSKPDSAILNTLKLGGFRWSNRQKMWYAKQSEQTIGVANSLSNGNIVIDDTKNKSENNVYDLWDLTRTDNIVNHVDKDKEPREIAMEARRHIKPRFPMCNISITSDYNSVRAYINASPFNKDSDELKAICDYISEYIRSFKYCTHHDPYGDYGSSYNFYFSGCSIYYDYKQTDMNVSVGAICEDFQQKKQAFEDAENKRREIELEESIERSRIEHEESEKQRKIDEEKRDWIQACVSEKCVEYFVEGLVDYGYRKLNTEKEYQECEDDRKPTSHTCKVTKEIYMDKEQYDFFSNHLMMDWSFVAGTGGTDTDDLRISCMLDYDMMPKHERETVEWYDTDCVAILCDNRPMCVVDAQGFDYCRYVYFFNDETVVVNEHKSAQAITEEEREEDKHCAEVLCDISMQVIEQNNIIGTWHNECSDLYKTEMKKHIYNNGARFDMGVIRAIDPEMIMFKRAMYELYKNMNSIQEQFERANMKQGQKITIVKMGALGGVTVMRCVYDSYKKTTYAQYSDAVKVNIKPEHKRKMYFMYIHDDVLIYDGWLPDIPEEYFWEIIDNGNGIITKHGRYSSFDDEQYNVVLEYYKNIGASSPLIDTRDHGKYRK